MAKSKSALHGDAAVPALTERLAAGPISWGVCEVPGWGVQLAPTRVLAEIRSLGLSAVEAGPAGYLGDDASSLRVLLAAHELSLVGGFLPVVLHDPTALEESLADAERTAALYAEAGGDVLVSAAVVDLAWSRPIRLDSGSRRSLVDGLARLDELAARHGLVHALHPHVGTLVETAEEVTRMLESSEVKLCLDTGHLVIGGTDPAALVRDASERIVHVHLKDVRLDASAPLQAGALTLLEATRKGLFCPLGDGIAPIAETVRGLEAAGYRGWYVLEQDTALNESALPPPGTGPVEDARRSIEFLRFVIGTDHTTNEKEAVA